MAAGIQHQKIHRRWRWLAVALMVAVVSLGEDFRNALFIPAGYWLGLYIDPDLDMTNPTIAEARWRRSYYFSWMLPWAQLYGIFAHRFLGGHRSPWTHLPGISTVIRMFWFFLPFLIPVAILDSTNILNASSIMNNVFYGLTLSDTVHLIADL